MFRELSIKDLYVTNGGETQDLSSMGSGPAGIAKAAGTVILIGAGSRAGEDLYDGAKSVVKSIGNWVVNNFGTCVCCK